MSELYEKTLTTDRWPNRAVSPFPFDTPPDNMPVAIVHPGWGKRPEMHTALINELASIGFRAIGLDTRYGYADRSENTQRRIPYARVGTTNPFFDIEATEQNRYFYRRPTGLLQACVDLDIDSCVYIGHSEGVRIGLTAALADRQPVQFHQMILVNGVGTGDTSGPQGMLRANAHAIRTRHQSEASTSEALRSFRDSAIHFATHPRRTKREADVIQGYDAWADIERLDPDTNTTVMNARDDHLINFQVAEAASREHTNVTFIPTDGSHSNIYGAVIRELIISELMK